MFLGKIVPQKIVDHQLSAPMKFGISVIQTFSEVSTVIYGILFDCFPTVECVPTVFNFLVTSLTVKARNERESRLFAPLLMYFLVYYSLLFGK